MPAPAPSETPKTAAGWLACSRRTHAHSVKPPFAASETTRSAGRSKPVAPITPTPMSQYAVGVAVGSEPRRDRAEELEELARALRRVLALRPAAADRRLERRQRGEERARVVHCEAVRAELLQHAERRAARAVVEARELAEQQPDEPARPGAHVAIVRRRREQRARCCNAASCEGLAALVERLRKFLDGLRREEAAVRDAELVVERADVDGGRAVGRERRPGAGVLIFRGASELCATLASCALLLPSPG